MYKMRTGFVILLSPVYFSDWVIEIRHFSPLKTNNRAQLRTARVKPVLMNCCKQSNNEIDLPINVWVVNVVAEKLKTIKNDASAIDMTRRRSKTMHWRSIWSVDDQYDVTAIKMTLWRSKTMNRRSKWRDGNQEMMRRQVQIPVLK